MSKQISADRNAIQDESITTVATLKTDFNLILTYTVKPLSIVSEGTAKNKQ
jgi:hypothetical protein